MGERKEEAERKVTVHSNKESITLVTVHSILCTVTNGAKRKRKIVDEKA